MDQYCVVLCGLQAGVSGDAAAWQPVAAALKLDPVEFERRVVAVLPRIVRQDLDPRTADRIAQLLHAMQVDARVLPDDPQLVYIERAGASCGPLPLSALGDFIQPGESYRLHGSTAWQSWPAPGEEEPTAPDIDFGDIDETAPPLLTEDEPLDELPVSHSADVDDEPIAAATVEPPSDMVDEAEPVAPVLPSSDAMDQPGDFAPEETAVEMDAEPARAMPPPLPGSSLAPPPNAELSEDAESVSPDGDAALETPDDALINPPQESPTDPSDASEPATADDAGDAAPGRSRTGRLVLLLVLITLAVWAYRHWMADTQTDLPPPAATAVQPSDIQRPGPAPAKPAPPASVATAGSATAPPVSVAVAASVATAASVPAPAASTPAPAASAPTPATSASAPATAGSVPAPAATAATPAMATSAPAPAASSAAPATSSTGTLPARAGTIMSAPTAPAATTSTAAPPTH